MKYKKKKIKSINTLKLSVRICVALILIKIFKILNKFYINVFYIL